MGTIKYFNEDDEMTHVCTEEEFIKDAKDIPFETVLGIANSNETIREKLYHQLLLRARYGQYPEILRRNEYFEELEQEVLNGHDEREKIHLALYLDNDLIETYFGGIDRLVDRIRNVKSKEVLPIELAGYLADASLFSENEETNNKIIDGIDYFVERDYDEMLETFEDFPFPNISIDKLKNNKENNKNSFHEIVNRNSNRKHM